MAVVARLPAGGDRRRHPRRSRATSRLVVMPGIGRAAGARRPAHRRPRRGRDRLPRRRPPDPGPLAAGRPARRRRSARSRSGSRSTRSPTRSGPARSRSTTRSRVAFTVVWIVGMINSINFIDGLDGLSTGHLADRRGDARADQPDDGGRAGRPAVHRRALLRPGRSPARLPALELPPGVDLRRDERRDVRRVHPRRAVDPRHGQGRRGAARPRRADHRHVLDHRPAAGQPDRRRSPRIAATSTTGCSTSVSAIPRRSCSSTGSPRSWPC